MLKFVAFVVQQIFERTQKFLRTKTTTLLKFIKVYNKRKNVFADNTDVMLKNIMLNMKQLMSIQHAFLNLRLTQINRFSHILKKKISFAFDFDDNEIINNVVVDSFKKKKLEHVLKKHVDNETIIREYCSFFDGSNYKLFQ